MKRPAHILKLGYRSYVVCEVDVDAAVLWEAPNDTLPIVSPRENQNIFAGSPVEIIIGDSDALLRHTRVVIDAGDLGESALDQAAVAAIACARQQPRAEARALARENFDLSTVGIDRYARLYQTLMING